MFFLPFSCRISGMVEKIALFGFVSLIPVLAWAFFFQKHHSTRPRFAIFAFLAGTLSIIPIKFYERYWDTAVLHLEHINLFEHLGALTHLPEVPKVLSFVTASILVALLLFIFVLLLMFLFEILSGDNTISIFRKKVKKISEAPFFFISIGILIGIMAYLLAEKLHNKVWFFVIVGMLEEFVKHLIVRFSDDEKIHTIADAVSYSILVALGFAFIENIFYIISFTDIFDKGMIHTGIFIFLRSLLPVAAHVCFSAILGYFYGISRFAREIYAEEQLRKKHWLIEKAHQILHVKGSVLFHEEKMMEGLILAMGLHAVFNSLLEFDRAALSIPFIGLLLLWVLHSLHTRKANRYYQG